MNAKLPNGETRIAVARRADFDTIVDKAPFEKCNLLILAFVHTVSYGAINVAVLPDGRDNRFTCDPDDDHATRKS